MLNKNRFIIDAHGSISEGDPSQITPQHDSFKTRITPKLATAIRYLIYKRSTFFGNEVNRVLPNATAL